MSQPLVTVTIDGRTVQVPKGTLLIQAMMQNQMDIPYFCYHPKLEPAGVCRMCMVQVEKIPKPQTACTTPVADGMIVHTQNETVAELRRSVLEFTLVNHPLDCPVCDKGGECDLQDLTFQYGAVSSRLAEAKEDKDKAVDLGQFIVLDNERCILCRRCVRFDDEIATEGNLIIQERAHHNVVTTTAGERYDSYFSGNTIELCPVGALTSDLYRFKARPWDLSKVDSVCSTCSVGCSVRLDYRHGKLLRLVAGDNPETDGGWLCDRGRFNYQFVASEERLTQPLIRKDGQLVPATWSEALSTIAARLGEIKGAHGADAIGLVGGGKLTNEEAYLFQKLGRAVIGTNNVDYRVGGQVIASLGAFPGRLSDINTAGAVLVVDVLPGEVAPVLDLRIRRLTDKRQAKVAVVGAALPRYRGRHLKLQVKPGQTAGLLAQVAQAVSGGKATGDVAKLAETLTSVSKVTIVWGGNDAAAGKALLELAGALRKPGKGEEAGRTVHVLIPGEQTNSRGAETMGVRPDLLPGHASITDTKPRQAAEAAWGVRNMSTKAGLETGAMLQAAASGDLKALYLAGANLVNTWSDGKLAAEALQNVEFLVVQDLFLNETAAQADVVLPAAAFNNKTGTYTTLDGLVQQVRASASALPGTQADGEIFVAVAAAMGGKIGANVEQEIARLVGKLENGAVLGGAPSSVLPQAAPVEAAAAPEGSFLLVPVARLYAGSSTALFDKGFRHARAKAEAFLNPKDAANLGVRDGEEISVQADGAAAVLTVRIRRDVQPGTVQAVTGLVEAPVNRLGAFVTLNKLHAEVAD